MAMRNGLPEYERYELAMRVLQGGLFRKYRLDHLRKKRLVDVVDPGLTYGDLEEAVAVATCFRGK